MTFEFRTIRRFCAAGMLAACAAGATQVLAAQASAGNVPQTKLDRFVSHFDLAASATAEFTTTASGETQSSVGENGNLSISTTKTAGVLATLRGQRSPWVGAEFNFRFAKYNQFFDYTSGSLSDYTAQNSVNEYTLGYVARPARTVFGLHPFVSVGAGTLEFKPTKRGGQGLPVQARADYYYSVGGDAPLVGDTFGLRVGFHQSFYKAPDFGQNYLQIDKFQSSLEPTVGFYVHF